MTLPMLGLLEVTPWHWAGFILCVLFFLALDLGVFHRKANTVRFREALAWTSVWVTLSFAFGLFLAPAAVKGWTRQETVEFVTGYIIELSLSMDNVFVIALIFTYFRVPSHTASRVLSRHRRRGHARRDDRRRHFRATLPVDALRFGIPRDRRRMLFVSDERASEKSRPLARKCPVTTDSKGKIYRRSAAAPLSRLLVCCWWSKRPTWFCRGLIPAIFRDDKPFIISRRLRILGLRSLYFVLAG
jgi:tellurite resistance protein TerC